MQPPFFGCKHLWVHPAANPLMEWSYIGRLYISSDRALPRIIAQTL